MAGLPTHAFLAFAEAQVEIARTYLTKHAYAGLGLCQCGRLHPCDERRHWLAVHQHYRNFVGPSDPPARASDE